MPTLKKIIFVVLCFIQSSVFANTNEPEEVWLSAQLNHLQETDTFLFVQQDGKLLMSAKDWQYWHLKPPDTAIVKHQDEEYYVLDGINGVSYHVNSQELSINVTVDVALFESTQLSGIRPQVPIHYDSSIGAFLNYDLSSVYNDSSHEVKHILFGEVAGFSPLGGLESQFVLAEPDKSNRKLTRLNTTWTSDNPQALNSLILGDSSTTSVGWGSVRFAGVKWGTNYMLQPSMIKTPLLSLQGVAQMPSTVDVFINNIRSMSQKVPTGAFSIDNIPVISGDGQVRMVVTDMLGQEQVITQPYYMSSELLQTGLAEYSYELGVIRENYGLDNANYGKALAIASYRRGLTPYLTSELHGQFLQQQQTLHYGSDFLVPHWGAMKLAVAHSWHEQAPNGYAWNINTSYQSASRGVGGQIQQQSRYFSSVDTYGASSVLKSQIQLFANTTLGSWGAASVNYTKQQNYNAQEISFIQAGYNNRFWKGLFNAFVSKTLSSPKKTIFKLGVSIPLWAKHNLSLSGTPQNNQYSMSVQHSMPAGQGLGYQVSIAENSGQKQYQAAISGQNNVLSSQLRIMQANQKTGISSSIRGGLVVLDKQFFVTRAISQSFALVNVGDYANVGVYRQNQLIGKTNTKGNVLAAGLMPYQANKLSINAADLPLDAQINTASVEVYPKYKSGLYVNFDVKRSYAATMTILLDNGQPLPAGAEVYKQDSTEAFPVGFRGELYITGLSAKNSLTAEWKGQKCTFEVAFVMVDDSLPDLGNYLCKGVAP